MGSWEKVLWKWAGVSATGRELIVTNVGRRPLSSLSSAETTGTGGQLKTIICRRVSQIDRGNTFFHESDDRRKDKDNFVNNGAFRS